MSNGLIRLDAAVGAATETALVLRPGLSRESWDALGKQLSRVEKAVLWWIGDWLNYGEREYGETYTEALEETDYSLGTLQQAKFVAAHVEPLSRLKDVPWSIHQAVATLAPERQKQLLAEAADKHLTRHQVRERLRELKWAGLASAPPPTGTYRVLYADPPWRYDFQKTESRAIENQYPTMELEEIKALPVPAAPDCVLFLWATVPLLPAALEVLSAWGFRYVTHAMWDKEVIGMGYYFRVQHEVLLLAAKGEPGTPAESIRPPSVIRARRSREHSAKPQQVYELIERMYPHRSWCELFLRGAPRPGWAGWGNEAALTPADSARVETA